MTEKRDESPMLGAMFYLPALGGVLVLLAAMAYCGVNGAGHSALDLRGGWVVFGPLTLIGVGLWVRGARRAGRVTVVLGILGMAFGYFVHHLGIMQEYNHWAAQSLEPKNPHAAWWLLGYAAFTVVALVVVVAGSGSQSDGASRELDQPTVVG